VNLFAGFARDSRTGQWISSARPVAGAGAVSPRVFIDKNANGKWDSGEQAVSGAGFFVDRMSQRPITDEKGTTLITGIPPFEVHRVAISAGSLEDPLLVPARPGVQFVPRPGKSQEIDFPVLITGEVNGTTYYRGDDGRTRSAAGLQLELVSGGDAVAETRSAYDGFFQFTTVRPGSYSVRVKRQQAARLGVTDAELRKVTIDANGSVIDGFDLVLDRGVGAAVISPGPEVSKSLSVRGRVTICDKGAEGATLFLIGPAGSAEARTGADGSYAFENVPAGTYLVVFARETLAADAEPPRLKVDVQAKVSGYDIRIGPCAP
jgi:hypothetical protein